MSKTVRFQSSSIGGSRRLSREVSRDDHRLSADSGVGSFSDNEARTPTFTDEEYYELRKKLKKQEQKNVELEEAFRNKSDALTEVKLVLSKRQQDLSEEQARNTALKDRNELLESQNSSMKDQLAELTKENSRLQKENDRLDKNLGDASKDLERASKELERAKRKSTSPTAQPAEVVIDKKLPPRSKSRHRNERPERNERSDRTVERSDRPDRDRSDRQDRERSDRQDRDRTDRPERSSDKAEKDEEKERLMRRFDRSDDSDTKASTGSSTSSQRRRRQSTAAYAEPYVEPLGPGPTDSRRQTPMPQPQPTPPATPRMYDYVPSPFGATGYAQPSSYAPREAPLIRGSVYVSQPAVSYAGGEDTSYHNRPVTIPNTSRSRGEHRR